MKQPAKNGFHSLSMKEDKILWLTITLKNLSWQMPQIRKRKPSSSQCFNAKLAIVSIVVCLPWCWGAQETQLVTTQNGLGTNSVYTLWGQSTTTENCPRKGSSMYILHDLQNLHGTPFFLESLYNELSKMVFSHVLVYIKLKFIQDSRDDSIIVKRHSCDEPPQNGFLCIWYSTTL